METEIERRKAKATKNDEALTSALAAATPQDVASAPPAAPVGTETEEPKAEVADAVEPKAAAPAPDALKWVASAPLAAPAKAETEEPKTEVSNADEALDALPGQAAMCRRRRQLPTHDRPTRRAPARLYGAGVRAEALVGQAASPRRSPGWRT